MSSVKQVLYIVQHKIAVEDGACRKEKTQKIEKALQKLLKTASK